MLLAVLNGRAKAARDELADCPRGSAAAGDARRRMRAAYRSKQEAGARLGYAGFLHLLKVETIARRPNALLIGHSPHLGPQALHYPANENPWVWQLESTHVQQRGGGRRRILRAAARFGLEALSDEQLIALLLRRCPPPLPPEVARLWGLGRRTWGQIETERAHAPGGAPRHRIKETR